MTVRRRTLLGAATVLAAPAVAQTRSTLRFVPSSGLSLLDPLWSPAYITLCHGYAVFDALYATDGAGQVRPQMAEGHSVSRDGRAWTIRLREGLTFHDGVPVRAADCVASLRRWCIRQATGQIIAGFVDEWSAPDDRTIRIALKRPLPSLVYLMAVSPFPTFIMPERIVAAAGERPVTEMVGSGPFRFNAGAFNSGSLAVYERFAGYTARPEPPDGAAGGKVARVDRVEWRAIPDPGTAVAALQNGEVDWLERPVPDLLPALRTTEGVQLGVIDPTGWTGYLRFNTLQPPFDDERVRRAVLMAVNQDDFLRIATGDDAASARRCAAFFPCGTPFGTQVGQTAMTGDVAGARALVESSGHRGATAVLLAPTDVPPIGDWTQVMADVLNRIGLRAELATSDWGTVVQRRSKKEPLAQGGWSAFITTVNGPAILNPAVNFMLRGQGAQGYFGWYQNAEVEALVQDWLSADADAERVRLADAVQAVAFRTVPSVPLGQLLAPTAYRATTRGILQGPAAMMWNVSVS